MAKENFIPGTTAMGFCNTGERMGSTPTQKEEWGFMGQEQSRGGSEQKVNNSKHQDEEDIRASLTPQDSCSRQARVNSYTKRNGGEGRNLIGYPG